MLKTKNLWELTEFKVCDKKEPSLKEAQKFVGGYVETISLSNGDIMLFNEEGKIKEPKLLINVKATAFLLQDNLLDPINMDSWIVGDAMLIKKEIREGW